MSSPHRVMLPLLGSAVVVSATALLLRYRPGLALAALAGLGAVGVALRWRQVGRERARGWRFRPRGREEYAYQEWSGGTWRTLGIKTEVRAGRPQRVFRLPSVADWDRLPAWARDRRGEIVARMQRACPEPAYGYETA